MLTQLKSLFGIKYHPLNSIEISAAKLQANYQYLSEFCGPRQIAPVLKSNAYGHGLVEVARMLESHNLPFFCVDSLYEAYELQKAHVKTNVLIMGYVHPESLHVKKLPFAFAVFTKEMLYAIKKYQSQAPIHIFVDTGMHREGVPISELRDFVLLAKKLNLSIQGLMSHMAMADKPSDVSTQSQVECFETAKRILKELDVFPEWIHASASLALLHSKQYRDRLGNLGRAGIALYGIDPEGLNQKLQPCLQLVSSIVQIKELLKGDRVGYDFSFQAKQSMKAAVLPLGYNDGVDRRLSNKGFVLVNGVDCQILGRISMNLMTIDVSRIVGVRIGQRVVIFSSNRKAKNSIINSAEICQTIAYELLVHLNAVTKRKVVSSNID